MIDMLLSPTRIWEKPIRILIWAIIAVGIAIVLSWGIFPGSSSLVVITFTIIPIIPLMVALMRREEALFEHSRSFFRRHRMIPIYSWYFVGIMIGFSIFSVMVPSQKSNELFEMQYQAISDYGYLTAQASGVTRECIQYDDTGCIEYAFVRPYQIQQDGIVLVNQMVYTRSELTYKIFRHNLAILLFAMITSFIFGAGAIFVLTWNASILGIFVSAMIGQGESLLMLSRFLIHGIPEFMSFFIAAIAGGIVSVAAVKHRCSGRAFTRVVIDGGILLVCSIVLLFIAAILEVYI